jgi:hypothetical protein
MVFPVRVGAVEMVHAPDRAAVLAGIRAMVRAPAGERR